MTAFGARTRTTPLPTNPPLRPKSSLGPVMISIGVLLLLTTGLLFLLGSTLAVSVHGGAPVASAGHLGFLGTSTNSSSSSGVTDASLLAIAASICIAGGFIGTGMAQSGIGASGMGIIAEKPEKFGQVLVFFVIPETLWILGLVFGIILLKQIL